MQERPPGRNRRPGWPWQVRGFGWPWPGHNGHGYMPPPPKKILEMSIESGGSSGGTGSGGRSGGAGSGGRSVGTGT